MKIKIYNKTLDPKLWDKNLNLNREAKMSLLKIAQDFYKLTELKSKIFDILLIGSSVNYNWTSHSDLDLHLLIDFSVDLGKENDEKLIKKFMRAMSLKWNNDHDIYIKGHKVEVYLQDIEEKNRSEAGYSILSDEWIKKPIIRDIKINKNEIKQKYNRIKTEIDDISKTKDPERLKSLMKYISIYRDSGLESGGEYSTENIVFKILRNTGILKKLKELIKKSYDELVSIKEKSMIG